MAGPKREAGVVQETEAGARIRPIEPRDDAEMATIIRSVMTEFGAVGEGYSINDAEVDEMCAAYSGPGAAYWVVEQEGRVLGGAGFGPLAGGDDATCELKKMYLVPGARGRGLGRQLIDLCLDGARGAGYARCYLETLEHMAAARRLYEAYGFEALGGPLGATGHTSCNGWYLLEL